MNASYTFDDTLNYDTGTALLRRPRNKMLLSFTRLSEDGRSSLTLSTIYVGTRLDTGNHVLNPYMLLNPERHVPGDGACATLRPARQHHPTPSTKKSAASECRVWDV